MDMVSRLTVHPGLIDGFSLQLWESCSGHLIGMQTSVAVSKFRLFTHGSTPCLFLYRAIKMLAEREDIDLERELHRVYKMFCTNQAKLVAMKGCWCQLLECCAYFFVCSR